ncbi:hypothetical protein [Geminicoccus roseus]|uniref:hypothetical protein n=1 Tax=Geminicoccus roseus TaxID=404900 RepID=UPI0004279478|nr:hypothetical protein [Geminicoccus roseus]
MIWDFVAALVRLFVIEPFQADFDQQLSRLGAPAAVVQEVASCASAAQPVLIERIGNDPWWGAATIVRLWIGTTSYEAVLGDQVPACAPALKAAQPFLQDADG